MNKTYSIIILIIHVLILFDLLNVSYQICVNCKDDDKNLKIFYNGTIYTSGYPSIVTSMVIDGEYIIDIGDSDTILKRYSHINERINLNRKTVIPGFIDSHGHLIDYGIKMINARLDKCKSIEEVLDVLYPFYLKAKKEKTWLFGSGWDQFNFPSKDFPTRYDLDKRYPDVPIILDRVDGHAIWVNSEAIRIAGDIPDNDPPGGKIIRDKNGIPTGIFIDNAIDLIRSHKPKPTNKELYEGLQYGIEQINKLGITSIHYAGASELYNEVIKKAIDNDDLNLRIHSMINDNEYIDIEKYCRMGPLIDYKNRTKLSIRSVKLMIDGALGSRGAALLEPYSDDPNERGLILIDPVYFKNRVKKWVSCGYQVGTHAIGDRANRIVLETYDQVIRELNKVNDDLRLRIEHAQIIHKDDFKKFKQNNIIASIQPTHATSDMRYAEDRLGKERILGAYAWKTFINNTISISLGSDFPVESPDPLLGFYAAVSRKDLSGYPNGGWYPEQKLTRMETLKGFTIDAAYASFLDNKLGSLEPNKLADFIILSDDIMKIHEDRIPYVHVISTYIGGRLVYRNNNK